jgi:hypothetical protein
VSTFFPDETPKRLDIQALYRESVEPRTFFLVWDTRLDAIYNRWLSWGLMDPCIVLRAAWVTNWTGYPYAQFKCFNYDCSAPIDFGQPYPKPSLFIRTKMNAATPQDIADNFSRKWKMFYPYHESGHWLYFILQDHSFWLTDKFYANNNYCQVDDSQPEYQISSTAYQVKCNIDRFAEPLEQFTEAFAETHVQQFLVTNHTDYGDFERVGNEVDSACEAGYTGTYPNYTYDFCDLCSVPLPYKTRLCSDTIQPRCSDALMATEKKYHQVGVIPQITSFLLDLFDEANTPFYDDNDGVGPGMDNVAIPFSAAVSCLRNCGANVIVGDGLPAGSDTANVCEFLDIMQTCCSGLITGNIGQLRQLYFMTDPKLPTSICP